MHGGQRPRPPADFRAGFDLSSIVDHSVIVCPRRGSCRERYTCKTSVCLALHCDLNDTSIQFNGTK